jgi:hypothetical protein
MRFASYSNPLVFEQHTFDTATISERGVHAASTHAFACDTETDSNASQQIDGEAA